MKPHVSNRCKENNITKKQVTNTLLYETGRLTAAIENSGDSSKTTHGDITCVDACRFFGSLIFTALKGNSKDDILSVQRKIHLCPEIDEVANGSYMHKEPPEIKGSGYVVKSLEAALWAFYHTDNFKDAILDAVNLGDDADTTAAICGQIAGAYYGMEGIPRGWLNKLTMREEIEEMAVKLYEHG